MCGVWRMFQATLAQCKAHAHLTAALKFIAYLQSCLFRPVYIHIYISSVKTVQACFGTQQGFCTFGSISQPKFFLEWLVLRSMHCNQYFALWAVSSCLGSACDAGGHCVVAVHEHSGQCQHTCSWYSALGVQSCKLCVFIHHQRQSLTGVPYKSRAFEACPEAAVGAPGSAYHQSAPAICMAASLVSKWTQACC